MSALKASLAFLLVSAPCALRAEEAAPPPAPAEKAAQILEDALGPEALKLLSERHYLVFENDKKLTRLLYAQWPALKAFSTYASEWGALARLLDAARTGGEIPQSAPLEALQKAPTFGLVSDDIKTAVGLVQAARDNAASLGTTWATGSKLPLLYRTAWGKRFMSQTQADLLSDFRALAPSYFEKFLSAPADNEAEKHFVAYLEAVYDKKAAAMLQASRAANVPTPELVGWIAKYLLDQSRLLNAARIRERLATLDKSSPFRKDLKDLTLVAGKLAAAPETLAQAQSALSARIPAETNLSSERLHVHSLAGPPLDLGDSAEVSLAYWVDGLKPGESISVTELGFVDQGEAGIAELTRETLKRPNGGPYIFKAKLGLNSDEPMTYRLILNAPGAEEQRREVEIAASKRLHDKLLKAAKAQSVAWDYCRPEEARSSFFELAQELQPLDGKPQFAKLDAWVQKRSEAAKIQADHRKRLLGFLAGARLHESKEQCDFSPTRAQDGLRELKELPPGCDRMGAKGEVAGASETQTPLAPELYSLLSLTERHRASQEAFAAAVAKARKLEEECKPAQAAEMYASAMALLDSDPQAHCGAAERDYTEIHIQELPRARSATAFLESVEKNQEEAARKFASGDFSGSLAILNPLVARIDSVADSHCYKDQRRKAQDMALASGVSLAPRDKEKLKTVLSRDDTREAAAAVNAELKKFYKEEDLRRDSEMERQMPPSKKSKREAGNAP